MIERLPGVPFIHATHDSFGTRRAPVLAFVTHMAESSLRPRAVAGYLSGSNVLRRVSVHFTVEGDGEVIQMLNLSRVSGSINPGTLRTDNDALYGYRHAKAALGAWWSNPNHAVLTVELAGRALDGPTPNVVAGWIRLVGLLRQHGVIGRGTDMLGHRDFQNVKPCPGRLIPWSKVGGHGDIASGPIVTEDEMPLSTSKRPLVALIKQGATLYRTSTLRADPMNVSDL